VFPLLFEGIVSIGITGKGGPLVVEVVMVVMELPDVETLDPAVVVEFVCTLDDVLVAEEVLVVAVYAVTVRAVSKIRLNTIT
jgi:hypothetical protein